jgi:hypothetical protein
LEPIDSWNRSAWSGDIQRAVWPVVEATHFDLRTRYGDTYVGPPRPRALYAHDEIDGLIPLAVPEEW